MFMNRTKRAALSLAEVLVMCSLFTLFGVMTLQAMVTGMRSQSRVTATNTARRNVSAAFALLKRDILNSLKGSGNFTFGSGPPGASPLAFTTLSTYSKASYQEVNYSLVSDGASPPTFKLLRQVGSGNPRSTILGNIESMTYVADTDPALVVIALKTKEMRETLAIKVRTVEVTWAY
jgi:hypothetical protein